jgi:hypothetical protein
MIHCSKNLYEIIAYKDDLGDWFTEKFLIIGFEVGDVLKPISLSSYGRNFDENEIHRGILHEDGTVQGQYKFFMNIIDFVDSLHEL